MYPLLELLFAYTRKVTRVTVPLIPCTLKRMYVRTIGEPSTRNCVDVPKFMVALPESTYESAVGENVKVAGVGVCVTVEVGVLVEVGEGVGVKVAGAVGVEVGVLVAI